MYEWFDLQKRRFGQFLLRSILNRCVVWQPAAKLDDGYSIILACVSSLAPLAVANLRLCAKSNGPRLSEIIVVFDCLPGNVPQCVLEAIRELSDGIEIRVLTYTKHQHRVARLLQNGWVYSWMSWCIGIAHAKTRAVIIHDLDAMPIASGIFEQIYDNWLASKAEFCGIDHYQGNGVTLEMGLVRTYELALDSNYVRRRFRPIDLYNKTDWREGRIVKLDTMLHAQMQSPRRVVRRIDETQLVHPSQLICHYTGLISGRSDLSGKLHSLPMLPYFMYLGGDATGLDDVGQSLARPEATSVKLCGRSLRIDGIPPEQWAWMEKQIRRLEQTMFGETRAEVEKYLAGFIHRAGSRRTVGSESDREFVIER